MKKWVLILGANSDIGKAVAKRYANAGYALYLAGRNINELKNNATDLALRYQVQTEALLFDALDYTQHNHFYQSLSPKPTGVICMVGYLGEQQQAEDQPIEAQKILNSNFNGCINILEVVAKDFRDKKSGFIVGVSSVAGDRGRASNNFYGAAKAGFTAYLSGLRNRLYPFNVHVLTAKPGFVATRMTAHLNLPKKLTATPEAAAQDIFQAQQKNKDVVYTKWLWRFIMLIIVHIPERIFKRLKL